LQELARRSHLIATTALGRALATKEE